MKTKRIRALLVAGLLSLAPAVTLTSCGGGGGGSSANASLSGHRLEVRWNNAVQTIDFGSGSEATSSYTLTVTGDEVKLEGKYTVPQLEGALYENGKVVSFDFAETQVTLVNTRTRATEVWEITYDEDYEVISVWYQGREGDMELTERSKFVR